LAPTRAHIPFSKTAASATSATLSEMLLSCHGRSFMAMPTVDAPTIDDRGEPSDSAMTRAASSWRKEAPYIFVGALSQRSSSD
jgi:hypothetical protein